MEWDWVCLKARNAKYAMRAQRAFKKNKQMNYRKLGKTQFNISEISLGTWQVGGK